MENVYVLSLPVGAQVFPTMHGITINDVPEPMTITLLGFGGLLLRRRKKNSV